MQMIVIPVNYAPIVQIVTDVNIVGNVPNVRT